MATLAPAPSKENKQTGAPAVSPSVAPPSPWPYRDSFASIRPLNIRTKIGEEAAVSCYLRMKKDELEEWTFPGMEHPSLRVFLNCCQTGFILGFDAEEKNIVGFGSLLELEYPERAPRTDGGLLTQGKASGMYCFFRDWHHTDIIRHAAQLALRYWFEEFRLRLIMGSALSRNMAARAFARRLGFTECGTVPSFFWKQDKQESAAILALERASFGDVE